MSGTAMRITLYGEDDEVKATYSRSFVPWRLLKQAIKLQKTLSKTDGTEVSEDDLDSLASLVVESFGNQFSIEDLNDGADVTEMMTVLITIVNKARGTLNPTLPPAKQAT